MDKTETEQHAEFNDIIARAAAGAAQAGRNLERLAPREDSTRRTPMVESRANKAAQFFLANTEDMV